MTFRVGHGALLAVVVLASHTGGASAPSPPADIPLIVSVEAALDTADSRARMERILGHFADAMFELTDGAYRLGRVRVLRGGRGYGTADVRWASGEGAPHVHGQGGITAAGGHIQFYDTFLGGGGGGLPKSLLDDEAGSGYALAHEWAHYALGLYDEHRATDCGDAGLSADTLMANPWRGWLNLSASGDAVSCQARAYGAPAWRVLARPTDADPRDQRSVQARTLGPRRHWPALADAAPPAGAPPRIDLPSPLARGALRITWVAPITSIELVIGRHHYRPNTLDAFKLFAGRFVDLATDGQTRIGISMFDAGVTRLVESTLITDATTRAAMKQAIAGITRSGGSAPGEALADALARLQSAPDGEGRTVVLISNGEQRSGRDPLALIPAFVDADIPIVAVGIEADEVGLTMQQLAAETGGAFFSDPAFTVVVDAVRASTRAAAPVTRVAQGAVGLTDPQTVPFLVDPSISRVSITVTEPAHTRVRLVDPSGRRYTARVVDTVNTDDALAYYFDLIPNLTGPWALFFDQPARASYTIEAWQHQPGFDAAVQVRGPATLPDLGPVVIEGRLTGHQPVAGVVATAAVTGPTGATASVALLDDGHVPDAVADDGVFAGTFVPWQRDSAYTIVATFEVETTGARETFRGSTLAPAVDGTQVAPLADRPISGPMTRAATTTVFVASSATAAPPRVIRHPSSVEAAPGDGVTFAVDALSAPGASYRWQRRRAGASVWHDLSDGLVDDLTVTGATETMLQVGGVTTESFGDTFRVTVTNPVGGVTSDAATIRQRTGTIAAAPHALVFTVHRLADGGRVVTPPQDLTIWAPGQPAVDWTATASAAWLEVPSRGTGSRTVPVAVRPDAPAGATGTIRVASVASDAASFTVNVTVHVTTLADDTPPFGQVDTPAQDQPSVRGTIAFTGWALDDTGVAAVRLYRGCVAGDGTGCHRIRADAGDERDVVYVADGSFVEGARPDVERAHPHVPQRQRAGWGVVVLTTTLPNTMLGTAHGGQGPLAFSVLAVDTAGNQRWLGRTTHDRAPTTLWLDNEGLDGPFGTIDTPAPGAVVSGLVDMYGWALTPDPAFGAPSAGGAIAIPGAPAAVTVVVDGVAIGSVRYGLCRGTIGNPPMQGTYCNDDIASLFGHPSPQPLFTPRASNPTRFRNLDDGTGAIGHYTLDTRLLTNGLHSVAWAIVDSAGRTTGIGSRYITVRNVGSLRTTGEAPSITRAVPGRMAPVLWMRTGFALGGAWRKVTREANEAFRVSVATADRLELQFPQVALSGQLVVQDIPRPLPGGSNLSGAVFSWAPPAGYLGDYPLRFAFDGYDLLVIVTVR